MPNPISRRSFARVAAVLTLGALSVLPASSGATYPYETEGLCYYDIEFRAPRTETIPIDAHPWFYPAWCEVLDPDAPFVCVLESDDDTVPVEIETGKQLAPELMEAACDDYAAAPDGDLIRVVPSRELAPDTRYVLVCEESPITVSTFFVTRDSSEPSMPPPTIARPTAYFRTCGCDSGEALWMTFEENPREFFAESGVIELDYSSWKTLVLPELEMPQDSVVPRLSEGEIRVTPVAANGVRGETVVLTYEEVRAVTGQGACSMASETRQRGVWFFLPLVFAARGRRRSKPCS